MGHSSPTGPLPSSGPIRLSGNVNDPTKSVLGIGEEFSPTGQCTTVGPVSLRSMWVGGPNVSVVGTYPHNPPRDSNTPISMKEFYGALGYIPETQQVVFSSSQVWTAPITLNGVVSIAVVGAGGGGGTGSNNNCNVGAGGGGGAGGVLTYCCISITPGQNYNIIIGAGGAGSSINLGCRGASGGDTSAFGNTAFGGGGGAGLFQSATTRGASGGGGASGNNYLCCQTLFKSGATGGAQGNAGGNGLGYVTDLCFSSTPNIVLHNTGDYSDGPNVSSVYQYTNNNSISRIVSISMTFFYGSHVQTYSRIYRNDGTQLFDTGLVDWNFNVVYHSTQFLTFTVTDTIPAHTTYGYYAQFQTSQNGDYDYSIGPDGLYSVLIKELRVAIAAGGGGGGAGSSGGNANSLPASVSRSGKGGDGILVSILQKTVAGGGAGGRHCQISGNLGGAGGGGCNGKNASFYGSGGGGGGSSSDGGCATAGNGYPGVVVLRGSW